MLDNSSYVQVYIICFQPAPVKQTLTFHNMQYFGNVIS